MKDDQKQHILVPCQEIQEQLGNSFWQILLFFKMLPSPSKGFETPKEKQLQLKHFFFFTKQERV